MALTKYINLVTFETSDEIEGFIECDYEIANTIALLNKKGYKTIYSCAGHNKNGWLERLQRESIENYNEYLEKYKNDKSIHIVSKDDKYFYHKNEEVATFPYISFNGTYNFSNLPKGFKLENFNNNTMITKRIDFFEDENCCIRKNDYMVDEELQKTHKDLYNWALSLKEIKKGDKYE